MNLKKFKNMDSWNTDSNDESDNESTECSSVNNDDFGLDTTLNQPEIKKGAETMTLNNGEPFYDTKQFAKTLLKSTEEASLLTKLATRDINGLNLSGNVQGRGPVCFHYVDKKGEGSTVEFPFASKVDPYSYTQFNRGAPAESSNPEYYKDKVEMEFKTKAVTFSDTTLREIEIQKDLQALFNSYETRQIKDWLVNIRDLELIKSLFAPYFTGLEKAYQLTAYENGKMPLALRTVAGTSNLYQYSSANKLYTQLATALPDVDSGRMSVQHIYQLSDKVSARDSFKFNVPPIKVAAGTYDRKTGFAIKENQPACYILLMNTRAARMLRADPEYQKMNLATRNIFGQASPFTNRTFLGVIGDIWCYEEPLLDRWSKVGTEANKKDVDWSILFGRNAIGETLFIDHLPDERKTLSRDIIKAVDFGHGCKTLMYPLEAYNETETTAEGNELNTATTKMEYGIYHSFTKNED